MKSNGELYCEYVFIYTEDVIAMLQNPNKILQDVNGSYRLSNLFRRAWTSMLKTDSRFPTRCSIKSSSEMLPLLALLI